MSRIYVTGDTHQSIDIKKLNMKNFPIQKELTREDYLIICGDFGMVWNNSKEELYWRNWLNTRNYTTLWVDGNHENFDLLEDLPTEEWNGGKVQFIEKNIIRLMRGQVFDINGYKFFTMGGGTSIDKADRKPHKTWWEQEIPTAEELQEGEDNLEAHDWNVDYVITHTTSNINMRKMGYIKENSILNNFFDFLEYKLEYKEWFFGHFHTNEIIGKHRCLYNDIVRII